MRKMGKEEPGLSDGKDKEARPVESRRHEKAGSVDANSRRNGHAKQKKNRTARTSGRAGSDGRSISGRRGAFASEDILGRFTW